MRKIFVLSLGLTLLAAACNKTSAPATNENSNTQNDYVYQTPTANPPPYPTPSGEILVVQIMANGFLPVNLQIRKGVTVKFVNNDTQTHWPASNPHPTHTDLPGFDAKAAIQPGGSYSYTFTKTGTWGYHDHLSPAVHGSIIVTE